MLRALVIYISRSHTHALFLFLIIRSDSLSFRTVQRGVWEERSEQRMQGKCGKDESARRAGKYKE